MNEAVQTFRERCEALVRSPEGIAVNAQVTEGERGAFFNLRVDLPDVEPSTILMGVYQDGRIWSYSKRKLGRWAAEFAAKLNRLGIGFHHEHGSESYWHSVGSEVQYEISSRHVDRLNEILRELFSEATRPAS
jgi:hypothetical protein